MDFQEITCATCLYSHVPEQGPVKCRRHAPRPGEAEVVDAEDDASPDEEIVVDPFPETDPDARCGQGRWILYGLTLGVQAVDLVEAATISLHGEEKTSGVTLLRPEWLDWPQYAVIEEPEAQEREEQKAKSATKRKPSTKAEKRKPTTQH